MQALTLILSFNRFLTREPIACMYSAKLQDYAEFRE